MKLKYIKLFENLFSELESEINNLCEYGLVSLTDDGFIYIISNIDGDIFVELKIQDDEYPNSVNPFIWPEIKDEFVPFLELLNTKYNNYIIFNYDDGKTSKLKCEELLKDDFKDMNPFGFESINIVIKSRK
jgi:hypothetical protein